MPRYGPEDERKLSKCEHKLADVIREANRRIVEERVNVEYMRTLSVRCGFRGREEQEAAFDSGNSPKHWPDSRHNKFPSQAVDVYPYPCTTEMLDDPSHPVWQEIADIIFKVAKEKNVKITWGGTWKNKDCPHFQIEV